MNLLTFKCFRFADKMLDINEMQEFVQGFDEHKNDPAFRRWLKTKTQCNTKQLGAYSQLMRKYGYLEFLSEESLKEEVVKIFNSTGAMKRLGYGKKFSQEMAERYSTPWVQPVTSMRWI